MWFVFLIASGDVLKIKELFPHKYHTCIAKDYGYRGIWNKKKVKNIIIKHVTQNAKSSK